ncbi:hypothetical protein HKD37_19G053022 [Glycine soja]
MRRYGGGMLYAALPLHMQRGCFRIRTHDQQVTKAQLYRCTRARPLLLMLITPKIPLIWETTALYFKYCSYTPIPLVA